MTGISVVAENPTPVLENPTMIVVPSYRPDVARQKLGKYSVDQSVGNALKEDNIVKDLLDGKKVKKDQVEDEIKFVRLAGVYNKKAPKGEALDPLSIGVLYGLHKDTWLSSIKQPADFARLAQSETCQAARNTTLLSLAEASLSRMEGPDLKEIETFQKYLETNKSPYKDLSDLELRDYFIELVEEHPGEFLPDYFVHFRSSENIFMLGELAAERIIESDKNNLKSAEKIRDFLSFEDRERTFGDQQFWRRKILDEAKEQETNDHFAEALHGRNDDRYRSEQTLLDMGVMKEEGNALKAEDEFIGIFADYFESDQGKSDHNQNQMVLGMLYNLRTELGVGRLPQTEVLQRAKELIPGLRRAGNDFLATYVDDNFEDFSQELRDYSELGLLGKKDQAYLQERAVDDSKFRRTIVRLLRTDQGDAAKSLINLKYVDGFKFGEAIGHLLKEAAKEKSTSDREDLTHLDLQQNDENATMRYLAEGKEIEDPAVRERVERAMKKTSHLQQTLAKVATKARLAFQNKLFYTEGESPFMAAPSLKTEATAAGTALLATAAYGSFVNNILEDPVNRGVEAGIFMAGYFIIKEGGAVVKEIRARQEHDSTPTKKGIKSKAKHVLKEGRYFFKSAWANRKDISGQFWHNKGKLFYSSGSYLLTSAVVNAGLAHFNVSGPEAWLTLGAANTAVSGLLSGVGLRSGAEFFINALGGKKAVDGGMELLTGNKKTVIIEPEKPAKQKRKSRTEKRIDAVKAKIASNLGEIKVVRDIMERGQQENRQLALLEKFRTQKDNPETKFSKDELVEVVEFLNWMKQEEEILMIHNPRFYSQRRINRPDGTVTMIDNREGLENIDRTRLEIVEYAQANLSHEEYEEVFGSSLDFFTDIKTIRELVWYKRSKYLLASYGYRVSFMVLSHAFANSPALLERPIDFIFGDANSTRQQVIGAIPVETFHTDITTSQGKEEIAKEIWGRANSLNNLANLMNSSEQLASFQPGIENNLEYWGLSQPQMDGLVNQLKEHNMNTADLMRFVYVLSSYKEGQEYLAKIPGFEGTEHRNLTPLVEYLSKKDPYVFMEEVIKGKDEGGVDGAAVFISLKHPDLAQKLGIATESLAHQVAVLATVPPEEKAKLLAAGRDQIFFTKLGPQVIAIGNIATEFVDGLSREQKQFSTDFLIQVEGILKGDVSSLQQAVQHHYATFLADANQYLDFDHNSDLNAGSINRLSGSSIIYKIYQSLGNTTEVVDLLNRAKSGDINAYNQLYQMVEAKDQGSHLMKVFDSDVDTSLYDKVLNGLPGDSVQSKEEIVRRIQSEMIGPLYLRPVNVPIINLEEMTDLGRNPDIFVDPRQALNVAFSPENKDLEMAVNLTGDTKKVLVQNGQWVGEFQKSFQVNADYSAEDLGILNAIEGSESENNEWTVPKMFKRNISYLFGQGLPSGTTPPAGTLIEMMTGPFGAESMNSGAPSALHNYDKYGVDYLTKLIVAHFRGRIPDDLIHQMGPDADLTQSIHDKHPSIIDRLCNKFETLIAAKQLVARYGEEAVHKVYLNHVILGTVNGVEIKGVEAASQVLFNRSFKDLTIGEKFLIEALGQSPGEYLFDNKFDKDGHLIESIANPSKAIQHAIHIIEAGKIGDNLDRYLPGQKAGILNDLKDMESRARAGGWEKVFVGGMKLPAEVQNFASTPDATQIQGMSTEEINEAIRNGVIKSASNVKGVTLIVLNDINVGDTSKIAPGALMAPEALNQTQNASGQLAAQYAATISDAKLGENFFTTKSGSLIPAWRIGPDAVVPGAAIVTVDGSAEHVISMIDPTETLGKGPALVGSGFKPLVVLYALTKHPEYATATFKTAPITLDGLPIRNSSEITDSAGAIDLAHTLASSSNVAMAELWVKMRNDNPEVWTDFRKFAGQFGINFYELNSQGQFVPLVREPLVDVSYGNIYVGGKTPAESGLVAMTEFYQQMGEMGYKKQVPAAKYIIDALTNPQYKKDIPIWWPEALDNLSASCGPAGELCAGKTATQSGVDQNGNWIAVRAGTFFMKFNPVTNQVSAVSVLTAGQDENGHPTELTWGSEIALPVARRAVEAAGSQITPNAAEEALNNLFINPENIQNYRLGAISVEQFYPFLKSLSNEEQYASLREAIIHGKTKYLFVDLIGAPIGKVQPVSIHLIDGNGVNKLITLNVSASIIEPAGPIVSHFADSDDQTVIYQLLEQSVRSEPEKFGGLLNQLQSQGINFIPIHNYEASPALFALHEQMKNNKMLFAGAEDAGSIMKQLGLDPKTTVFVNDEVFKVIADKNPPFIAEQLFAQREFLAMASIYENSGLTGSLDTLLYNNHSESNAIYQLLRIFAETKTSQVFTPLDGERKFLIDQFQQLIDGPKGNNLAPDVVNAYNIYNTLSGQIARGEAPDPSLSKDFIEAMKRFPASTSPTILHSLGISIKPSSIPLPEAIISTALPDTTLSEGVAAHHVPEPLKATGSVIVGAIELVNNFIKHPENFQIPEGEKHRAQELTQGAIAINDILNSPATQAIQDVEQKKDYIMQELTNRGLVVDRNLLGPLLGSKQCVMGYLVLNDALAKEGIPGFVNMQGRGGTTAKSFINPLFEVMNKGKTSISIDSLFMQKVDKIPDVHAGDAIIIYEPWMETEGGSNLNPGHIVQVLFSGTHQDGSPYIIIFDTNGDKHGTTTIREISNLNDFISKEDWDIRSKIYPNPKLVKLPEPLFAIIRPED